MQNKIESNTTCFSAEGAIVSSSGTNSLLAEFAILEFAGFLTDTNIKVFITKKYAQCETSHTLKKLMYSNCQIIKIMKNCFQNMNCFSEIKLISILIHSRY